MAKIIDNYSDTGMSDEMFFMFGGYDGIRALMTFDEDDQAIAPWDDVTPQSRGHHAYRVEGYVTADGETVSYAVEDCGDDVLEAFLD